MNVLILTDFSHVAMNAAKYGIHLFKDVPSNFYLFNFDKFDTGEDGSLNSADTQTQAVENLYKHFKELQSYSTNKEHRFKAVFSEDNLVNATRKFVAEKRIDLIVMGAAGKDSIKNTILGNHTYEIIRKIKCNLLAVPESCSYVLPEKLILPIDYSASFDNGLFKFFEHPGITNKAAITVMEIADTSSAQAHHQNPRELVFDYLNIENVKFVEIDEKYIHNKRLLQDVQKKYDMIVILGKNLNICDRFLDVKCGVCADVSNKLPILVLHG
ncbi:universal stress protein [Gillisia limnaea]|uniref:UspA domain-containing protein n=1 Tax=Gillisia limnaea (strain DSM 15749 / LMG 21470 / R-8282) TaxID=865937 RepID=H2BYC8_GILLR|nr:universal stress protein [Gillisia limnaea]EHQ03267.1 UspA domain-containing protein [Gillisia limnaea DSM 15749]